MFQDKEVVSFMQLSNHETWRDYRTYRFHIEYNEIAQGNPYVNNFRLTFFKA